MERSSPSLNNWREFFRSANADIFQVIEHAIHVAAVDFTQEFLGRRDQIAEKLFTALLPSSSSGEDDKLVLDDKGDRTVREVMRIKEILTNHHDDDESDGKIVFDSLRKLQFLDVTFQVLKTTEIGKAVNGMRKHKSRKIRLLAHCLIVNWNDLVDCWLRTQAASTDNPLDSGNLPNAGNYREFNELMKIERCHPLVNGEQQSERHSSKHTAVLKERAETHGPEAQVMMRRVKPQDCIKISKEEDGGLPCLPSNVGVRMDSDELHFGFGGKSEIQRDIENRLPPNDAQRSQQEPLDQHVIPKATQEETVGDERKQSFKIVIKLNKQQEPLTGKVKCEGIMNKDEKTTVPDSGRSRSEKIIYEQEAHNEMTLEQFEDQDGSWKNPVTRSQCSGPSKLGHEQKVDTEMKPTCYQATDGSWLKSVSISSEEALLKSKLEVTKRKLREGYLQAENAKRQRTIRVLELNEIPKKTSNDQPIQKTKKSTRRSSGKSLH